MDVEKDKMLMQIPRGWMLKRFQNEAANRYLGHTCVSLWLHITIKLNTQSTNTDRTVNTTKQDANINNFIYAYKVLFELYIFKECWSQGDKSYLTFTTSGDSF